MAPRQMDLFADANPVDLLLPRMPLLTTPDVSRATGLDRRRISEAAAAGELDAIRFVDGKKYYIPRPSAAAFLAARGVI